MELCIMIMELMETLVPLTNCSFNNNSANNGGAIYNGSTFNNSGISSPILTNCSFSNNSAINDGGAITNYTNGSTSSLILTNCSFSKNTASNGGGIYNYAINNGNASPNLTNCSFSFNSANNKGGGVYNNVPNDNATSSPKIRNCIFWGNSGSGRPFSNTNATPDIAYSLIEETDENTITTGDDYTGTRVGLGMIYAQDPLFVDASNGDLNLQENSLAIDAGSNGEVPGGTTSDLAGNDRIFNGTVDMGAYEFNPTGNGGGNSSNIITSLNELEGNIFKLYPNPVINILTIEGFMGTINFVLINNQGKEVLLGQGEDSFKIDLSGLPSSVYTLILENQVVKISRKLVKY